MVIHELMEVDKHMLNWDDREIVLDELRNYIAYTDNVLDAIWEEANDEGDAINADWRSDTLDKWLIIEYYVGRHSPDDLSAYDSEHDPLDNDEDALSLGKISLYLEESC